MRILRNPTPLWVYSVGKINKIRTKNMKYDWSVGMITAVGITRNL